MIKTAIAVAAIATAATVSGYATYPELCGTSEFTKFATILVTSQKELNECQSHAGNWTFIPPTRMPLPSEQAIMCENAGCDKLLANIQALKPTDCFLSINNSNVGLNIKQFTDEYRPFCDLMSL